MNNNHVIYRIKATNIFNGDSMIMTIPVFTDKAEAAEFAAEMQKLATPAALFEVVEEGADRG